MEENQEQKCDDTMSNVNPKDQDPGTANVHVTRKNPRKSWKGDSYSRNDDHGNHVCKHCGKEFESSKDVDEHRRSHTGKAVMENAVCKTCGKVFESLKGLHGHMRCHSMKRSTSDLVIGNQVKKKTSFKGYNKCSKSGHVGSVLSSVDEVIEGALCLMMFSRGVRDLDGVTLKVSNQIEFDFPGCKMILESKGFAVAVDGSMEKSELKNKFEKEEVRKKV